MITNEDFDKLCAWLAINVMGWKLDGDVWICGQYYKETMPVKDYTPTHSREQCSWLEYQLGWRGLHREYMRRLRNRHGAQHCGTHGIEPYKCCLVIKELVENTPNFLQSPTSWYGGTGCGGFYELGAAEYNGIKCNEYGKIIEKRDKYGAVIKKEENDE